jgi:NhaC family Na+:H+ antiporter
MNSSTRLFFLALIPIAVLVALLYFNVLFFADDSSYGPNQIALLFAGTIAAGIGVLNKTKWKHIYDGIIESITTATGAIIILLLIGALAGTWLLSGIVPAMIHYGLMVLNPSFFLVAAAIICAVVSIATGSSWGTVATVGIALLGIGQTLGIYEGWIAGAVISGAYFGDKMSPLSDTTNLAPAVAGTDLITHIKHMAWTTTPSFIIALIVFLIAGLSQENNAELGNQIGEMQNLITSKFNISWYLFLVPIAVIVMIARKVPAIPALFIGSLLGGLFAILFQGPVIQTIAGETSNYAEAAFIAVTQSMALDIAIETGNPQVNDLLSTGGMHGMLNTVWLILCALTFGGIMQATGMLQAITKMILRLVNSTFTLVLSTAGSCLVFNILASDQYLAIVVPGKMFSEAYKDRDLAPQNLSRVLEDSGTVTSVLIPWNTCGVAQSGVLGVSVALFAPFCVFNYVSFFMTILFGLMGWKMTPTIPLVGSEGEIED